MTKVYFASDFHLGTPNNEASKGREVEIVAWLDHIKRDATALYLLGDVFDFWFEYHTVIPKGFVRFLGKLAELSDAGISITMFKGNHDMWMYDYLEKEMGVHIVSNELEIEINGKKFFLHHGDGLGRGDATYKILKKFFRSSLCQWLFARLHPNFGIGIARYWSRSSRAAHGVEEQFLGKDNEWLYQYCTEIDKIKRYDFFIFGHRHLPLDLDLPSGARYINLGEWLSAKTYAVFDGEKLQLKERRLG